MRFDADEIQALLILEKSAFNKRLAEAKSDAAKFSEDAYSAKLDAKNSSANKAIDDSQARAARFGRSSPTAKLKVDNSSANKSIDQTSSKISELGNIGPGESLHRGRREMLHAPPATRAPRAVQVLRHVTGVVAPAPGKSNCTGPGMVMITRPGTKGHSLTALSPWSWPQDSQTLKRRHNNRHRATRLPT